jgi:hypothetical protein
MKRLPLVLLLLAAILGHCCAEAYYKEPGKAPRQHYKKDAKRDYTPHKAAEEHQPKQHLSPSYGGKEQQHECKDDCPNPQPADSVSNGEFCVLFGSAQLPTVLYCAAAIAILMSNLFILCSPHAVAFQVLVSQHLSSFGLTHNSSAVCGAVYGASLASLCATTTLPSLAV